MGVAQSDSAAWTHEHSALVDVTFKNAASAHEI